MSLGRGNSIFLALTGKWSSSLHLGKLQRSICPAGHYEWLRKLLGLKLASLTFQRTAYNIFACMLGNCVWIPWWPHCCQQGSGNTLKNLTSSSSEVTEDWPQSKLSKCEFIKADIKFLGNEVDGEVIHTSDNKITVVKKFPKHQSVGNAYSFLRLAGYYRPFTVYTISLPKLRHSQDFSGRKVHSIGVLPKRTAFKAKIRAHT